MTECVWITRIMIVLTDKGFLKAAENSLSESRLTFYLRGNYACFYALIPSSTPCYSLKPPWCYDRGFQGTRRNVIYARQQDTAPHLQTCHPRYCCPWHLSEKRLYGPQALLERCQALIGEPVIFCCWTIDFYLHSYLLMDTKPVAVYWSSLQRQPWKETEQREEWRMNL